MTSEGQPVRIRSFFLPETAQTIAASKAQARKQSRKPNPRAQIPFTLVTAVVAMTPDSV
jgi:hypothetical protein